MAYPQNKLVIDMSHYQTVTDFSLVRGDGVVGVIHKFSEGVTYRDPTYEAHRVAAKASGLIFGRYHFGNATDVAAQVANFLTGWQHDELLALDWEASSNGTMTLDQVVEFHDLVLVATGIHIVLYSGSAAKDALKAPNPILSKCRLWLAQYASAPVCPLGWSKPWLWQWTQHGSCAGISSNVDLDAFDGTEDELRASWVSGDVPVVPAPPVIETQTIVMTMKITAPKGTQIKIETLGPELEAP